MNFDSEAGRRFQVFVVSLVYDEGSELVFGDFLPVQSLKSIHVPRLCVHPEDLAGGVSSEHILGILAVYARLDLGRNRM